MALDLGELTVALEVENNLHRGLADAKREISTLSPHAQNELRKMSRVMEDEGDRSGNVLAQGIRGGLVRNSPLIVAGVAGALAAGAPLMLAAASTLFGGIGIAAAVQSDEVRQAWSGLGDMVMDEVDGIAGPMTDTLVTAAEKTAAAYRRMKPEIVDAVAAAAPHIDKLVESTLGLAENALPGMTRAVEQAGPAVWGLGMFLESTGTGLSDFFDAISAHGPEAGTSMDALGDTMAALLPTLGELLGQGAELGSITLPLLASGMGGVLSIAQALGPALPAVVSGFAGMKIARAATDGLAGGLDNVAGRMGRAGLEGTRLHTATTSVASGMRGLGTLVPVAGLVLGAFALEAQQSADRIRGMSEALLEGGQRAHELEAAMVKAGDVAGGVLADDFAKAQERTEQYIASLTPLERAQLAAGQAQTVLSQAIEQSGEGSLRANEAAEAYKAALARVGVEAGRVELAIHGVTQAMVDQANQALASIDSGFAYQNSLNQLEDAQKAVADAVANRSNADENLRTSTEDVERAQLALSEQSYRTALAFGQQQADMSGAAANSTEYARILQEGALVELHRLRDAAGPELAAALDLQIGRLEASGVSATNTGTVVRQLTERMQGLGLSVQDVPGQKFIRIDAPTEEQRARIEALGYKVITLPNGDIYVAASTADAEAALAYVARPRSTTITATVVQVGDFQPRAGVNVARAAGGPIVGAGSGTSDSIPAVGPGGTPYRLSNGEHIWTAREVAAVGGHSAMADLRRAVLSAGPGRVRGYATGGGVGSTAVNVGAPVVYVSIDGRQLQATIRTEAADVITSHDRRKARDERSWQ